MAMSVVCGSAALIFATKVWACHHRVWSDDFADYATWYSDLFEKHAKCEEHRLALAQEDEPSRCGDREADEPKGSGSG